MRSIFRRFSLLFLPVFFLLAADVSSQVTWTRDPANPVLKMASTAPNDPNGYYRLYTVGVYADSGAPGTPNIPYQMWFGSKSVYGYDQPGYSISHAISPNKRDWYLSMNNPVLTTGPIGSFDDVWVLDPNVIYDGTEYKMYYSAYDGARFFVGLATSPDALTWTKSATNPVLSPTPGAWDAVATTSADVYFDGTTYRMVYSGYDGSVYAIGAASSADGVHWTKHALNPVLTKGPLGSWDSDHAISCAMTVYQGVYYLFYQGVIFGELGLATSSDGVSWTKYSGNPLFPRAGSFENGIGFGSVIVENGKFELWYSGLAGAEQIGHASSPVVPLSVVGQETPAEYALSQNYPNPFNPSTTIRYQLKTRSAVELRVYNTLGEIVATLVSGVQESGPQTVRWDADKIASGAYFYRLSVTDLGNVNSAFTSVAKMMLIK